MFVFVDKIYFWMSFVESDLEDFRIGVNQKNYYSLDFECLDILSM
jgi:hypothetical protein